jgi:5-methylcytosine-specific restriction endonuclease McrA
MDYQSLFIIILVIFFALFIFAINRWLFNIKREQRRDYYREYLKTEAWKRKRYVVFKRDNWRCVSCGAPATEVHHLKYAKWNI